MSLWELINLSRNRNSTSPHDRIYALLGLAQSAGPSVPIDYHLSPAMIFTQLTLAFINDQSVGLNCLCLTGNGIEENIHIPNLPSWVPNFANPGQIYSPTHAFYDWSDSEISPEVVVFSETLELSGIVCCEVEKTHPWNDSIPETFQGWLHMILCLEQPHLSGLPVVQVLFRTLIFDDSGFGLGLRDDVQEHYFFGLAFGFLELRSKLAAYDMKGLPSTPQEWTEFLGTYLDPMEITHYIGLEAPFAVRAFALWLITSPIKLKKISVRTILEEFCGPSDSSSSLNWPDLD
ncbi:hypothetical protein DL95DRAFT_484507 [Leptodontidium sp. 2 PMI_412]|nr:hypothetical protein DL95DRAFT_484507 [Leptodontidium sp. 2 PMI_412]